MLCDATLFFLFQLDSRLYNITYLSRISLVLRDPELLSLATLPSIIAPHTYLKLNFSPLNTNH